MWRVKSARRTHQLPAYPFARWNEEIAGARQAGCDIIRLDIGNPDLPPPETVVDALCRGVRRADGHGYAGYRGIPALRQAMTAHYAERFDVPLDPEREIVPLIGSKEGLVLLSLAILDPGDLVLLPDPGYAPYTRGARLAEAETYALPLRAERGFLPDLAAVPDEIADRATLLWLNYPNNPTGAVADRAFFEEVVDFARAHGLLLCHDAPYSDVTYGDYVAPSVLQIAGAREIAVEFNSLSKMYNMAGWRVGMAVGNAEVLAMLAQLKSNLDSGHFRPIQEAAAAALRTDPAWVAQRNAIYAERLALLHEALTAVGFDAPKPRATLYLWAPIPANATSEALARDLLYATGVAVAPGAFFGPGGEGYLRFSVTAPTAQVREAAARLRAYF
ncbi:MAG: aminotransferase class I/II-fold pyridoxal phosphate-dependent enzyme [Chloroflexi bacterium]|jgi:LL-diaminopimelate aminotransferase|nr:aminotransferase class I/II-fold pyridoxal phosphate-dependent enzyme [Chloroflexota bacterium]